MDFINNFKCIAAFAVHFVTESKDRQIAQPAHFKQLLCLALNPLGPVDHHYGSINSCQGAVGVFRKIRVARRVNQIKPKVAVFAKEIEGHGRGRHGNPAVFFHRHKIRARAPRLALGAHLARHLNRATKQQEFFRQGRFARIRVRNDRKGAAPGDFRRQGGAVCGGVEHGWPYRLGQRVAQGFPALVLRGVLGL